MNNFFYTLCFILLFSLTTVNAQNYSTHNVRAGETIEEIAKRYYVTPLDIYQLNPETKKELKPNTVLIIPISKAKKPKITIIKELQGFKKHKTKRKETLFSLGQKYSVTVGDIRKYNTFLYADPLRKGDKLQIPIFKIIEEVEAIETTKTHIVLSKETKWGIAYKYRTTIEELKVLNPEMSEVLQEGETLVVPNIEKEKERKVDKQYSYYEVLPKEGFYRLKIKLNLTQEALERLNPGLAESGLKLGMILKIPFTNSVSGIFIPESDRINLADSISDFRTKHIAVMLPFRLNRVDFDSISGAESSIKNDRYLNTSLDFHSGVLMAIDSLKNLGVSLKVDVYDTKNQVSTVSDILTDNDFETVDAVIGPLTRKTFNKVASSLKRYNIPVIAPLRTDLVQYNNVFQSRPSNDLIKSKIVDFVKSDTLMSNIIIISDSKHIAVSNSLKVEFYNAKQVFSRKDKEGVDKYFVTKKDIEDVLKPGHNIVFLETKDEGFVSNVTSMLASLIKNEYIATKTEAVGITLVTTHINKAFEGDISNEHLSKLQFHYATSSKVYNEEDNNSFVKKYKSIYYITPNSAAVKGFDLTMDVVLRMVAFEDLYTSVISAPLTEYVENKFAYQKKLFGGYYNNTVYLVKHQDLTVVEVKE